MYAGIEYFLFLGKLSCAILPVCDHIRQLILDIIQSVKMKRQLEVAEGEGEDVQLPKSKKANTNGLSIESRFRPDLFESSTLEGYTKSYAESEP